MKKYSFILIIVAIFGLIATFSIPLVKADSGWDSSYDSGGSDWSSSDSSWSSSDWSSSSSSSSGGGSGDFTLGWALFILAFCSPHYMFFAFQPLANVLSEDDSKRLSWILFAIRIFIAVIMDIINPLFEIFDFLFLFVLAFGVTPFIATKKLKKNRNKPLDEVDHKSLEKYGLEENQLKTEIYQKFVDIQNAWMEFDYDTLKKLCDEELYQSYKSDLEVLSKKHGKNIMSDFKFLACSITNIYEEKNTLVIYAQLYVSFRDYVIDVDTNKVTRGSKNTVYKNDYELEFEKRLNDETVICPNCGAKVEETECSYCHSTVKVPRKELVLRKKKIIK